MIITRPTPAEGNQKLISLIYALHLSAVHFDICLTDQQGYQLYIQKECVPWQIKQNVIIMQLYSCFYFNIKIVLIMIIYNYKKRGT